MVLPNRAKARTIKNDSDKALIAIFIWVERSALLVRLTKAAVLAIGFIMAKKARKMPKVFCHNASVMCFVSKMRV